MTVSTPGNTVDEMIAAVVFPALIKGKHFRIIHSSREVFLDY